MIFLIIKLIMIGLMALWATVGKTDYLLFLGFVYLGTIIEIKLSEVKK